MRSATVRWGILGPGAIAREFLRGAADSQSGVVAAVGTRNAGRADLATHFPGLRIHGSYEALLADSDIDAVYIATPHTLHPEWAIRAAQAGKHVLCEKPAATNAADVERMFAAALANGTFMAEAFMYRLHPLTALILELVRDGKIGRLQMIKSSFGFAAPAVTPQHRLFARELGGGAILDVGGYPMSMARLIAGAGTAQGFSEPLALSAVSRIGPTGVDEISAAVATFPNGVIAQLSCSVTLVQDNVLHVFGSAGRLEVDAFWFGTGRHGGTTRIRLTRAGHEAEAIELTEKRNVYSFQFEAANAAIIDGRRSLPFPGMSDADSIGNARALDSWMASGSSGAH